MAAAKRAEREPMSKVDTAWLRMESPSNLMMITGVLIFRERLFYLHVPGQHRRDVRDPHALGRFTFRYQKIPNAVLRHDSRSFLCQRAP